jgi:hypothetical protein
MTSLGPCMIHCGSGVSVGVKVRVGREVSEGRTVGASVRGKVGVTVGGLVDEGRGETVPVGTAVGVGEASKLNPPQARRRKESTDMQITGFRKRLQGVI